MMSHWIKTIFLVLVILGTLHARADDLLVKTPSGPIHGTTMESVTGKHVNVFYGIPYAEPPIGDLKFGPPVDVKPWKDELNATIPSRPCFQQAMVFNGSDRGVDEMDELLPKKPFSEDCLKLHIWVPKTNRANYTVMVYIHGGGFVLGHPLVKGLTGEILASEENVIVVSMNYRLNMQGFLYLGIPEAPGNVGLMDQQMALKWVQQNIASFGGNPDDVTIFGMSAGGASVGFHLLSPGSRNLFKRAILMSGTPNAVWSIRTQKDSLNTSMTLAKTVGCSTDGNAKQVLQCLQSRSPQNLSDWNKGEFSLADLEFVPTVDGKFISDFPMNLLSIKDVKHADVIIGSVADEGSFFMTESIPDIHHFPDGITEEKFMNAATRTFKNYDELSRKVIPLLYADWTRPEDLSRWRDALKDLLSDYQFICASNDFVEGYSTTTKNTVYRYVVDHHYKGLNYPKWMGTSHGSDTYLHLGMGAGGGRNMTRDDAILSRRVMRWFANFARTGNPNGLGQSGPSWDPSTVTGEEYLRIAVESVMEKHFHTQQCTMISKMMSIINKYSCRK